ncbi:MAG: hypothetical protein WAV22_09765 [Porticoccaceae bacterium]
MSLEAKIDSYAYGKFSELVESLFCDVRPAREKLLEHFATLFIIAPTDFKTKQLQEAWNGVQSALKGKITNYGSERIPQEAITVRNATLERVLRTIWGIHSELHQDG